MSMCVCVCHTAVLRDTWVSPLLMSFVTGNSPVTLRWCSQEVKTPCSFWVSLCTDPCCVSRFSEANSQRLWRGWASQGPYESNPCSYKSAWASPHPPVLHLEFSAPSLLAGCHVEWWDTQAESSSSLGLGLQPRLPQANSIIQRKLIVQKNLISWAIMN